MKKITLWLLVLFLVFHSVQGVQARESIEKLAWSPIFNSSEIVDIIVEGWEESWLESVEHKQNVVLSSGYISALSKWQTDFTQSIQLLPNLEVMDFYKLSFNGIWIRTPGFQVPLLAKSFLVKKIHLMDEKVFPTREIARNSIQMPSYNEAKEREHYPDGSGTVIGIVDTGIFYGHEDFWPEGSKEMPDFPNDKTISGYDFADKDENPVDDRNGHGTHVAGIAAGNHSESIVNQGIAPKAALIAYKVFSSKEGAGGASSATIVSAAESALEEGCTVINLSLGHDGEANSTYDDSPYYTALDNAVKGGVVVVAAAGNEGSRIEGNPWPIHSPGVFLNLIQVAASDDRGIQQLELKYPSSWTRTVNGNLARYTPLFTEEFNQIPVLDAGFGREEDFKEIDVKGKVVLIQRGPLVNPITFQEKNRNARANGAVGCIIYNYSQEGFRGTMISPTEDPLDFNFLPTLMVSGAAADQIRFCLQNAGAIEYKKLNTPIISDYTSAGPCLDGDLGVFKPEVCAPGTMIRSAVPANDTKTKQLVSAWTDLSGTSMATPVVTGAVALLKQTHPEWTPYQVKCALMNTADLLINPINQEVFSFYYQGAGQINVQQALQTKALITPPSVMRCSGSIGEKASITIKNITDEPLSVEVRSVFFTTTVQPVEMITNKPFLAITPHSSETIEYWFHSETKQFDWTRMEGVIWFQIVSQNQDNVAFQSLHVPMIFYSESTNTLQKPVQQVFVSNPTLNRKEHPIVTLGYTIGTGSVTRTIDEIPGEKEGETKIVTTTAARNYVSVLQMQLFNEEEKLVYTQYLGEQIPVGTYQFAWDGKALEGMDVLPDGTYTLYISTKSRELFYKTEAEERKLVKQSDYWEKSNPVQIEIKNSQASVNPVFLMATPRKVTAYSTQGVSFYLEKSEEIDEVKIQISYDKEYLSPILSEMLSFKHSEALSEFSWTVKRPFATESRFFLGEHLFQWSKPGVNPIKEIKVTCYFRGVPLKRDVQIITPDITITEEESCVGDLNQDNLVNRLDYELWLPHFGTTWRSIGWNAQYDLNYDWVIDVEDLLILCRCME